MPRKLPASEKGRSGANRGRLDRPAAVDDRTASCTFLRRVLPINHCPYGLVLGVPVLFDAVHAFHMMRVLHGGCWRYRVPVNFDRLTRIPHTLIGLCIELRGVGRRA